jgi:hypothetical protein
LKSYLQRVAHATAATDNPERATYFRPRELCGVEALHATFVEYAYRPHSHPTWTIAVVEAGAAQFSVERSQERADAGELFVLEPDAVHTGMAAVPEGWTYKVLYLEPDILGSWAKGGSTPRASRWVVFRDRRLRDRLVRAHAAFAAGEAGIALEVPVVEAVAGLRPHLRPFPEETRRHRVRYAVTKHVNLYVPKFKGCDDGSVFCDAAESSSIERAIATVPGVDPAGLFRIEAKRYGAERLERVLAIARPTA